MTRTGTKTKNYDGTKLMIIHKIRLQVVKGLEHITSQYNYVNVKNRLGIILQDFKF